MKDIPVSRGRSLIARLVAQGEHERQDFKFTISDAHKIARSVSAFANTGGGRLLIGVKDNGTVAGVRNEEDVYVVEQAARRYCEPSVEVTFAAYSVDTGVVVIIATIPQAAERPVRCVEPDGTRRAYCRVSDENIVAHPLLVRSWIGGSAGVFAHDEVVTALLGLLDAQPGGVAPESVPAALGVSRRRAESLIVTMLQYGLVELTYEGQRFVLRRVAE